MSRRVSQEFRKGAMRSFESHPHSEGNSTMNKHFLRRLVISSAAVASAIGGFPTTSAHADAKPGLLPASAYGNGCSVPGPNVLFDSSPPLVDPTLGFPFFIPIPRVFFVNFRPACDMHDAGYDGGFVIDPITGGIVNTAGQSRFTIDLKFRSDLQARCQRTIPWDAPAALGQCYGIAETYFAAVRAGGWWMFDA